MNYILLINHLRIRKCFNMFRQGRMYFWFWWLRRQCHLQKYCGLIHMHVQSWIYRWFLGVADTNDVIQKIEKTLNNTHTTTQKLTNNSFRNTKKHIPETDEPVMVRRARHLLNTSTERHKKKHTVYPPSWQYTIVIRQRDGLTIRKASKRLAKCVIYIYRSHQKVSKSR